MSFWSRLTLVGEFTLDAPLRITTGTGENNGSNDLVLDKNGQPYIPGSTFRGALRMQIEAILRGMAKPQHNKQVTLTMRGNDGRPVTITRTVGLCCESVDKREDDLNYQGCLTQAIVEKWQRDPSLSHKLDAALIDCSCQVCRLFGAAWLAGRVYVPDLQVIGTFEPLEMRGGAALNRDLDIAIPDSGYQRQAVPVGTRFSFRLLAENVTPVEQGILLLGLRSFTDGQVALGADRSRGFGRGQLIIDWRNCNYIDADKLISTLLGTARHPFSEADAEARLTSLATHLSISTGARTGAPHAPDDV